MSLKMTYRIIALTGCLILGLAGLATPANASAVYLGPVGSFRIVRIDPAELLEGSALGAARSIDSGVRDPVWEETWNNTSGQKWKMWIETYNVDGLPTVKFQNLAYSGICLDKSLDTASSNDVYLYPCADTLNQYWQLSKSGSVQYSLGKFSILNLQNRQYLTVAPTAITSCCDDSWHHFALYDLG